MELPQPPQDQELKNIIDKLAQFVARNGPEFEQMTKSKQKDNPKFSFLFGGDFFNYYQYKVTTEQAIIKHRQQHQPAAAPPGQHAPTTISTAPQTYPPPIAAYPSPAQYPNYPYPPVNGPPPFAQQPPTNYPTSSPYNTGGPMYHQSSVYPSGPTCPPGEMPPPSYPPSSMHYGDGGGHPTDPNNMPPMPPPTSVAGGYRDPYIGGDNSQQQQLPPLPPPQYDQPPEQQQQQQPPPQQQLPPPLPAVSDSYQNIPGAMPASVPVSVTAPPVVTSISITMPPPPPPPGAAVAAGAIDVPPVSSSAVPPAAPGTAAPPPEAIEAIVRQQQTLQEQIKQSEHNLAAQHQVLQQQKDAQVKEGIYVARGEMLKKEAEELHLIPSELSELLTTITETCTKDSISAGKLWIFTNATDEPRNNWIAQFLCYKATSYTASFTHKLHIIYLMNDVLHSCVRKGNIELKESLQNVLVPMFCHAVTVAPEDKKAKLDKLLSLWEGKLELGNTILSQLHNPLDSWDSVEKGYISDYPQVTHTITTHLDTTFEGYKQQHNAFVQHAATQLQQLEQQKVQMEQQAAAVAAAANIVVTQHQPQLQQAPPPSMDQLCLPPPGFGASNGSPSVPVVDFSKPPPGFALPPTAAGMAPDMLPQQPPPLEGAPPVQKENLVPSVPYFELPAGLMCPMVKEDDHKYRPLDPTALRLPPPAPPTERLLRAVDNFYLPPSHERPRNSLNLFSIDSEGWEQLSLYDYYKAKSEAVKGRQDAIEAGEREQSESPEPVVIPPPPPERKENDVPIRRYRSVSPEKDDTLKSSLSPNNRDDDSQSRSPTRSGRDPYSPSASDRRSPRMSPPRRMPSPPRRTPPRRSPRRSPPGSRRSPFGGRRSPRRRSRSLSPVPRGRTRSRSASPVDRIPFKRSLSRSPTPPSFGTTFAISDQRLGESNKGHQMLRKMGWGGSGLGVKEQGIENPIDAGDVREGPQERFRGLGVPTAKSDPYEAFRKNKGKAFISRMKARAEEKM